MTARMTNRRSQRTWARPVLASSMAHRRRSPLAAGFTLIELLLVMVIIAILAAVVVPRMTGKTKTAQIAAATADITNMKTALSTYEIDNGAFPTTEQGLNALVTNPSNLTTWKGPYVEKVPNDPWGTPYVYRCPGTNGKDFDLLSCGPDKVEGGGDDISP
jgi:general secretion pathway protein G